MLIPVICQIGQYLINPVTTKINPAYAQGVAGPQNASDVISNPSAIRIGRSVAPIFVSIVNSFSVKMIGDCKSNNTINNKCHCERMFSMSEAILY